MIVYSNFVATTTPNAGDVIQFNGTNVEFVPAANIGVAPVGTLVMYISNSPPSGWVLCNGQAISRTTYSDLFDIVGTTYGVGDNSTTFNVPNFLGRSPMGVDSGGAGEVPTTLGEAAGEATHALTSGEMPSHHHSYTAPNAIYGVQSGSDQFATTTGNGTITGDTGSGTAHNVIHPVLGVNFIIYTGVT